MSILLFCHNLFLFRHFFFFLQSVLLHYWVLFSTNSQLFSPDFLSFSLLYLSFPSFVPSCIFVLFLFSLCCSPFSLSVLSYPSPFQFYPPFPLCERGIPIFIPKFSSYGTLIHGFPLGLIFLKIWDTLFLLSILFFLWVWDLTEQVATSPFRSSMPII